MDDCCGREPSFDGSHRISDISLEQSNLIEHMCNVLAAYAGFGGNTHTLAAVVIDHRQVLDAPTVGQSIHHEVGAPGVDSTVES